MPKLKPFDGPMMLDWSESPVLTSCWPAHWAGPRLSPGLPSSPVDI